MRTPWGAGIDYSSAGNDPVRAYAIDNACYWLVEYGFDGLRLDAVPMISDSRERHVVDEICRRARESAGRRVHLVAEDVKNELSGERLQPFDGRWSDDAHHSLHVSITGERGDYFGAFLDSPIERLGKALTSNGTLRVEYLQNHDQIGNRPFGERIGRLAPQPAVRAGIAALMLAPPVPLLFMGEEWDASTPFLFFCDFEPNLAKRVTQGRRSEFAGLAQFQNAKAPPIPAAGAARTFERSKLRWEERALEPHASSLQFYRELLRIRRNRIEPLLPLANDVGSFELVGAAGLAAWWNLPGGIRLRLETNLGERPQDGFSQPEGDRIFATPGFDAQTAPAWSVRWSFGE